MPVEDIHTSTQDLVRMGLDTPNGGWNGECDFDMECRDLGIGFEFFFAWFCMLRLMFRLSLWDFRLIVQSTICIDCGA